MSLAATSGGLGGAGAGGAGGGLVLAHDAGAAGRGVPPPQAPHADAGMGAPPPSAAALGADLLDKQQAALTLKQVRNVSHMPIVAVDLFASEPLVSYFPKKPEDPSEGVPPRLVGKMKANVYMHANETAHKTLRKFLSKSKTFTNLQSDCLSTSTDKSAVVLEKPQRWLGLRKLEQAPQFLRDKVICDSSSLAIAEEANQGAGVSLANSTLDGSPQPQGDDFDRVVLKVRLNAAKKALTMLPEEGVQMLLHQAQYHVATKVGETEDDICDFPCAIAIPAWSLHDAAIEALYDVCEGGVFFQRSVCALAGALLPNLSGKPNHLLERLDKVRNTMMKEFRREDPHATFSDEMLVILLGMTEDGLEATAIQVSSLQDQLSTCFCSRFKVMSNVSYQSDDPITLVDQCANELEKAVEFIAPEADGPAAILTYGSPNEQERLKKQWTTSAASNTAEWKSVPVIGSKSDAVAMGAAVLGAVSHGRQALLVEKSGGKTKAELGISVQNVAPVAVGVRINYHGGAANKWQPVKAIFDFDRRIPAGPYSIDFKASECVVHRNNNGKALTNEEFLKAAKEQEGSKNIPKRQEAALALQVEIMQKWTRNGDWIRVGDIKEPLVLSDPDAEEEDKNRVACEDVTMEISLGVTGMITLGLVGERESVVQATQSARNSTIRYYAGLAFAVVFFGGFLVRSYWEQYTFERDTKKLLVYYKHAIPGSISDGDENNARWLVYKYRHKKQKLWKGLEKKYGVPVLEVDEWDDYDPESDYNKKDEDEEEDLDDFDDAKEPEEGEEEQQKAEEEKQQEEAPAEEQPDAGADEPAEADRPAEPATEPDAPAVEAEAAQTEPEAEKTGEAGAGSDEL